MSPTDSHLPLALPLALYVHWPWCLSKCPYCDFNSHVPGTGELDQAAYRDAILRELNHYAQQTKGRKLGSVFFGGGTPSLMSPETIEAILAAAQGAWEFTSDIEITLEANPTSIETSKFRAFNRAGINRVSVGIQALNNEDLQALGREHTTEDARRAIDISGALYDRFSFDLIYARPGQAEGDWADELELALSLAAQGDGGHISLYQLTIEPGTAFFRRQVAEADENQAADLYDLTQDICEDFGMAAYEISNHAKPGDESRHNLIYWQGGDYIGIGPGAHGRLHTDALTDGATRATHQIADPRRWLQRVAKTGHATAKVRELSRTERIEELVLSGLRLATGIDAAQFRAQTGCALGDVLNGEELHTLQTAGLIEWDAAGLRATRTGRLMLNTLIYRLLDLDPVACGPM